VITEHSEPVASIQIYFDQRAKFFPHRERTNGPKGEAGRIESGGGVLGRGQRAPHQLGVWGNVVSSTNGVHPGQSPGKKMKFGATSEPQNLLRKCLIMCKLLQKG